MNEEIMLPIKAGSLIIMTSGEYSDYSINGLFRAVVDINPAEIMEEYLRYHPDQRKAYHFERQKFIASLLAANMIESVDSMQWHLCNYADVDEMNVRKFYNDAVDYPELEEEDE